MPEFDLAAELSGLFRANIPLINLVTYEEDRVVQTIEAVAQGLGVYTWDQADLMKVVREAAQHMPKTEMESDKLLPFVADQAPKGCVVVLKDFHHIWRAKPGPVTRKLRNMAPRLRAKNQFLVVLTP